MKSHSLILLLILAFTLSQTTTAQNIPSYVPANGLVGWWPFNGNANDESGNSLNGIVHGCTLGPDRNGRPDQAYSFNGIDNWIELPVTSLLGYSQGQSMTLTAMVRVQPNSGVYGPSGQYSYTGGAIFTKYGCPQLPVGDQIILWYTNSDSLSFALREAPLSANSQIVYSHFNGLYNNYHSITAVLDGMSSTMSLYVDGIVAQSIPYISTSTNNASVASWIGKSVTCAGFGNYDLEFLKGDLDELGFWNRALSQQEITNLYQGSVPTPCAGANLPANLSQGLVGWWPFCGNANDESGNGNNGTVNGPSLTADRFGNGNSAFEFNANGVGEMISIPHSSSLSFTGNMSFSLWMKASVPTQNGTWLSKYDGPTPFNGFSASLNNGDGYRSRWDIGDGTINQYGASYVSTIGDTVVDADWHNIVGVYSGHDMFLYVDGVLSDTTYNSQNGVGSNSQDLLLGMDPWFSNRYYSGSLDDIGIWNRALTPQEITQLYNTGICYQTITVTDTLIINANLTNLNPVTFQNTIKVYPNPANDHITIDCGSNFATMNGYSMRIDNSLGQTVYSTTINQQSFYVDLNTWSGNGVYFVYLINNNSQILEIRKIVIQ